MEIFGVSVSRLDFACMREPAFTQPLCTHLIPDEAVCCLQENDTATETDTTSPHMFIGHFTGAVLPALGVTRPIQQDYAAPVVVLHENGDDIRALAPSFSN